MRRMRIIFEVDVPESTNRREYDLSILNLLKLHIGDGLVYAATEIADETHILHRGHAE